MGFVTSGSVGGALIAAVSVGVADTARVEVRQVVAPVGVQVVMTPADVAPCSQYSYARLLSVSTARELGAALAGARPGDLIRLEDGVYTGRFSITVSGSPELPIVLCGTPAAVLERGSLRSSVLTLREANHWILDGFTVTNGLRGLMLRTASSNTLQRLILHGFAQEAVHFQEFSSYNVIRDSQIRDTGLVEARYGEGVYIGSSASRWVNGIPDASDYNQVLDNVFGPNIGAESIDVKPGTTGGVIRGNRFSGVGTAEDAWVDLSGNHYLVEDNYGEYLAVGHGFRVQMSVAGWGSHNEFRNNLANLQGPGYGFHIGSGTSGNIVRCSNRAVEAGRGFTNVNCTP
jgi:hypothetical protein